jgi:hypothetical protein
MSVFIEGTAFPLGKINANGWGVPFTEVDNAIATLKNSVVRVCSRIDPHGCDVMGDPFSEIGHVVDAWREGDDIKVKAEITDSIAAQKIEDSTWKNNWSVFVGFNDIDAGGWVHGIAVESITIVNDPAWPTSTWKVVSASDGTKKGIRITSEFFIRKAAAKTEGETTSEETVEELKKKLADAEKELAELKAKALQGETGDGGEGGDVAALEKEVEELKASNAKLEKQIEEDKKLIASLQVEKAKMVPISELENRIAAALEKHDKEIAAKLERDNAFAAFAAARERLGLETKPEDFKSLSAADLNKLAEDLGGIKKAAASGSGFSYPTSNNPTGFTVGRWDSKKKEWVN